MSEKQVRSNIRKARNYGRGSWFYDRFSTDAMRAFNGAPTLEENYVEYIKSFRSNMIHTLDMDKYQYYGFYVRLRKTRALVETSFDDVDRQKGRDTDRAKARLLDIYLDEFFTAFEKKYNILGKFIEANHWVFNAETKIWERRNETEQNS